MIVPGSSEVTYFYHQDALGSVVALSKFNISLDYAEFVERYQYSAFGETTVCDGSGTPRAPNQSAFDNPYMFTGREYETLDSNNLKLYYYRARFYKPEIGRFLQTDPIGYSDSMNLYQYCGNNPVNFNDPFGLKVGYGGENTDLSRETVATGRKTSPRFDETYRILDESPIEYTIKIVAASWIEPYYDSDTKTIYWNPWMADKHDWGTNSPLFILAHEMEHPRASIDAYRIPRLDLLVQKYSEEEQKITGFHGPQDKYIVTEIEPILAREFHEDLRKRQDQGSLYKAKCPKSREPYKDKSTIQKVWEFLKRLF